MNCKITLKQIILGMLIALSLIMIVPQTVHAEGITTGNSIGQNDEMGEGNFGGPSYSRTGWLCVLTDSSGHKVLNSQVVFFPYSNSMAWANCNGTITTEFFEDSMTTIQTGNYINTIPCFNGSTPGGPILKAYFLQQCSDLDYPSNAHMFIEQYLQVPLTEVDKALADGKDLYIQYTPIFYCRKQGATKDSQGEFWISNSYTWAQVNPYKSWISSATHRNFPQSSALEFPWFGLGSVSAFKITGDYWNLGEWQANGLGLGAVKISSSYQVTITITDKSTGTHQTQYLSSGSKYTVQPTIGNAKLTTDSGFVSKKFTNAKSSSASYEEVKSGMPQIGSLVSAGTFDFLSREGAKALFLHYEGEVPPPETADTDLYSWELSVRIPGEKPGSTTEKRTDMSIEHHSFNEMQQRVVAWQDEHVFEYELEKQIEVDRSLAKDHDYKLSQDHSQFNIDGGIWQLYRGEYIDKWVYFKDLASTIFDVFTTIDPNYSYYLCRSHLESLGLVVDRGVSGTAGLYLSTPNAFVEGFDGVLGKEPQRANTLQTWKGVAPYNYQYVPTWANGTGAWIVVDRFTRQILPHTENKEEKTYYEI